MGREAFVIMEGSATVRRNGKKVAVLGPGAVVGELSLLDHGPRTATVTTDTEATVLVLDQRHFSSVIDDVPAIGAQDHERAGRSHPRPGPPDLRLITAAPVGTRSCGTPSSVP